MTTTTYKQLPTNFSRQPSTASLLPLGNNYNHPATTTASATTQQQRKTGGGLKPSRSIRVKAAVKAIVSPVKTRKEKKAAKMETREREEARRVANIDDFLLRGRIYYEKQLQNQMNYDPFADHLAMEKCLT
ncbi:hypothetical protein DFP73DRAFT_530993 [Morchella snyderi]|nr:hypothetical protein DFP73DRAFT_530993 [Morchella snyderi]